VLAYNNSYFDQGVPNSMSRQRHRLFFIALTLASVVLLQTRPGLTHAAAGTSTKTTQHGAAEGGKKTGFNGDPSQKRGMEIGFDLGRKNGKADQVQNLKPDPKRHDEFENPDKFYRYEYGSRAAFVGGFRSGYLGGYQSAFGKKIPLEPSMAGTTGM